MLLVQCDPTFRLLRMAYGIPTMFCWTRQWSSKFSFSQAKIILQNTIFFQNISCREIGSTEDSTPLVQLYISAMSEDKGELETRFVNKELVEQGCAQWVEHGVVA